MANPQIENGFTAVANELLEAIYKMPLSDYEHRVFWFVVRKTYGYQKKTDWIAQRQIVEECNILKGNVSRTVKKLLVKNMLTRDGKKIGIQKDYSVWKLSKGITIGSINKLSKEISEVIHTDTEVIQIDNKKLSIESHTKEKKETIQNKLIQKKVNNVPYKNILELFSTTCVSLPKPLELTDKRKTMIRVRYNRYGIDKLKQLFETTEASTFLTNRNGGNKNSWNATFDWILNENNMVKILEGNYTKKKNDIDWRTT